jgi:hypothetical protein
VVGITASFRRDDLSLEDQAAWVASEFGAYAYVVAMPAGDHNPWCNATVPSFLFILFMFIVGERVFVCFVSSR